VAQNDVQLKVGVESRQARQEWDGFVSHVDNTGNQFNTRLAAGLTTAIGVGIAGAVREVAGLGIAFNSVLIGTQRTFNLTREDALAFGDEIKNIAPKIGLLPQEFANIVIAAGKMGIAREEMAAFGETLGKLSAVSDVGINSYVETAGRITAIFNLGAEDFRRLGADVNALDDIIGGTTEGIFRFTARIAATGKLAGLTASEIAAFGSVFEKVGIPAERAGTAFETFVQRLQTLPSQSAEVQVAFTEVLGEGSNEFLALMKTDAPAAIQQFLEKINQIPDESERIRILLEIFGKESSSELAALAGRADLLKQALEQVGKESENLAKLDREFELQLSDPAVQLKQLKGEFQAVGIELGQALIPSLVEIGRAILPVAQEFSKFVRENKEIAKIGITIAAIGAVVLPVVGAIGLLAASLGSIGAIGIPIAPILGLAGAVGIAAIAFKNFRSDSLSEGIQSRIDDTRSFAEKVSTGIATGFSGKSSEFIAFGSSVIVGVVEGMNSVKDLLWNKVQEIGGIIGAIKDKAAEALGFENETQYQQTVTNNRSQVNFTYTPTYSIQVIDEASLYSRLKAYIDTELLAAFDRAKLYQARSTT
jgi:TP901 family phage tail tape measure protein